MLDRVAALPAFKPTIERRWPAGQQYTAVCADWTSYKLLVAEWYLEALEHLRRELPEMARFVGVEMAMDGFLAAACSAVDASIGALVQALDWRRGEEETPPHQRKWERATTLATEAGIMLGVRATVDEALSGKGDATPLGWLACLQRLRNTAIHQDTVSRAFFRVIGGPQPAETCRINVPGRGPQEMIPYFRDALDRCTALARAIIDEAESIRGA